MPEVEKGGSEGKHEVWFQNVSESNQTWDRKQTKNHKLTGSLHRSCVNREYFSMSVSRQLGSTHKVIVSHCQNIAILSQHGTKHGEWGGFAMAFHQRNFGGKTSQLLDLEKWTLRILKESLIQEIIDHLKCKSGQPSEALPFCCPEPSQAQSSGQRLLIGDIIPSS